MDSTTNLVCQENIFGHRKSGKILWFECFLFVDGVGGGGYMTYDKHIQINRLLLS